MRVYGFIFSLILLALAACHFSTKEPGMVIEKTTLIDSIPSASGIVFIRDSLCIISDDASGFYKLSLDDDRFRKININGIASDSYRVAKPLKHDFESAATGVINNNGYLLAFGSGTLSPHRDSLLIINLTNEREQRRFSLAEPYRVFMQQGKISKEDFNIEGATIVRGELYLFNRGTNMIIQINWPELIDYVKSPGTKKFPDFTTHQLQLPSIGGVQAGFSGACTVDDQTILFTASAEDTKNWVDDGKILGSYIGLLTLTPQGPVLKHSFLLEKEGQPIITKLESIDIISVPDDLIVGAVADNDDGSSTIYRVRLSR